MKRGAAATMTALRRFRAGRGWRTALAAFAFVSAASCTLLGIRDVVQCESDADCPAARPVCQNDLCTARLGKEGGEEAGVEETPCATTAECSQDAAPTMCIDGTCKRVTSTACPVLLPADSTYRENPVTLIGVYLSSPGDSPARIVVQFALEEINRNLPGTRVAAVLCEKRAPLSALSARDALEHLGKLHVPVVIGDFETSEVRATGALSEEERISIWSTLGNHPTIQPVVSAYFRTSYLVDELDALRDAYQSVVDRALARASEANGGTLEDPAVTLAATMQTSEIAALANHLAGTLTVNGVPGQLTVVPVDSAFEPSPTRDNAQAVRLILAGNPHVIIALGGDEILKEIVPAIEMTSGAFSPVYVVGTRAKYNINDLITLSTKSKRPNFRARLFGVDFGGARAAHDAFQSAARFATNSQLLGSFDHYYDAMYAAAYASVYAAHARGGDAGPLTGEELTAALTNVASGDASTAPITVGNDSVYLGAHEINLGAAVHFTGVTGDWKIDPATRSRREMGASVFCFTPKTKDIGTARPNELEYYLDADDAFDGGCATPQ